MTKHKSLKQSKKARKKQNQKADKAKVTVHLERNNKETCKTTIKIVDYSLPIDLLSMSEESLKEYVEDMLYATGSVDVAIIR